MADRSADLLEGMLLVGSAESSLVRPVAVQLAVDPPLALWCLCAAFRDHGDRPRTLEDVAQRLVTDGLRLLRWEESPSGRDAQPPGEQAAALADLVAASVELAELAFRRAGAGGSPAVSDAYLLGLLYHAPRWVEATAAEALGDTAGGCLPVWMAGLSADSCAASVREAAALLVQRPASDVLASDLLAAGERAVEVRSEWLVSRGGGETLPLLTARLARLETLEREFQAAVEHERLEAMYEFAAGAGHEINNPLTVISGRAQLLLQDEKDVERRRGLALIHAQAMRVYEMIADMSLFARPPAPQRRRVDLVKVVDGVVTHLAVQAAAQGTDLRRNGDADPVEIEADPTQLGVAVRAMCVNSLEALGHGGHIEVRVRRHGAECEIVVSDDGPGIGPEERAHLFDPYYCARQAGRGLGLGLSKSWRIVTQHGGRIEVASEPGRGATFCIRLPGP